MRWWGTGRPGGLQSIEWQRAGHDWATEQQEKSFKSETITYGTSCLVLAIPVLSFTIHMSRISDSHSYCWWENEERSFYFIVIFYLSIYFVTPKHFVLGYNLLAMLWQFQMNSEGTQPYMSVCPFSPRSPSHPGWRITLSRVPCATQ